MMKALTFLLISIVLAVSACTPAQANNDYPDLANTQWKLVSFGVPSAEMPVSEGSTITLEFGNSGQAAGSSGCNSYHGPYTVQDGKLKFSELVSTLMACNDQAVSDQETQYLQALRTASSFTVTERTLRIRYDNEKSVLNFEQVPALSQATLPKDPIQKSNDVNTSPQPTLPPSAEQFERVIFEPGSTSAQRSSLLPSSFGIKQYVLSANTGQTVTVVVTSDGAPLSLTITSPSGVQTFPEVEQLGDGFEIRYKFVIREPGDYLMTLTKADRTPSTNYTADFTIQ